MSAASTFSSASLSEQLATLASFTAPGPGVTRLVYDEHWCDAHAWLRAQAAAAGLVATADAIGNLWIHDPALKPGTSVIAVGSHLDTVVNGGRYDGLYGTIAGLMLAAELRGRVAAFVTCEEEGSRFPAALTGVRGLLGELEPAHLRELRDRDGLRWEDALAIARGGGCAAPLPPAGGRTAPLFRAARQLELHIEQGPVLEASGEALGIVNRIAGYRRIRATLGGEARHAGTTPMDRRHDAFAAAAEIALAGESLARERGAPAVATAGFARVEPGLFNVVPGACTLGLEVRHTEAAALETLASGLAERANAIATRRGVTLELALQSGEAPTPLSDALADGAVALARQRGIAHRVMPSGAGHDTMLFAQSGVPALMLFVPSRGGISHSPDEYTAPEQLWAGVAFARDLLKRWTQETA
jgi:allantoate deiminase